MSLINNQNINLVIVGEDSWKKERINIRDDIKSRVIFLKNISNEELGLIYSKLSFVLFL